MVFGLSGVTSKITLWTVLRTTWLCSRKWCPLRLLQPGPFRSKRAYLFTWKDTYFGKFESTCGNIWCLRLFLGLLSLLMSFSSSLTVTSSCSISALCSCSSYSKTKNVSRAKERILQARPRIFVGEVPTPQFQTFTSKCLISFLGSCRERSLRFPSCQFSYYSRNQLKN